jgi:predicted nucleic acid-binding protein
MIAVDSSILVAALFRAEKHHASCLRLVEAGELSFFAHGLAEVFSTMTGGRAALRIPPHQAAELLAEDIVPALHITTLTATETVRAISESAARGIQGGALYDFLHLAAARKAKAERLYTLNGSHFQAFHRSGDPEIAHPEPRFSS